MFKALSSSTRVDMIKILLKDETHISALAKKLGISVPVAAKHVRVLETAGLVERREFGRSHVLRVKGERLYEMFNVFTEISSVELPRGRSALDALKVTCAVRTKRMNDKEFLVSIDGEEGFYLYEVNGEVADIPMNNYRLRNNDELKLKKLIPVTEKTVNIKTR